MLCLDLCCGLGGFSRAFVEAGWDVVRVDVDKGFRPTVQADVNWLPFVEGLSPDCLLMSPCCERFSLMANGFPKRGIGDALRLVGSCLEAVVFLKPKKWLLENPKGRLRWFIGVPRQSIRYSDFDLTYQTQKPTDLWGNVDLPFCKFVRRPRTRRKVVLGVRESFNFVSAFRGDTAARSCIPFGVSKAVLEGCVGV